MKGIIYKYTFPDGKVYIGQTRNPEKRKLEHIDPVSGPSNSGFWEAYQRFGTYEYEVLHEIENDDIDELVDMLNLYESGYIYQYQSDNPMFGYNRTTYGVVGTGAKKILDDAFQNYLDELLKTPTQAISSISDKIFRTRQPLTDDELYIVTSKYKNQSIWYRHIKHYDFSHLEKLKRTDDAIFYIEEYIGEIRHLSYNEAVSEATLYVGNNRNKILKEERDKKAIVQLDKQGNIIKEYYSAAEICQAFNVPRADNVWNALKGKQKTAYGYYWMYKKDMTPQADCH